MPSTTAINHYLHNVFGACLQSGAAGARTIALALLFDYKLFSELRETIARRQLRPSSPPEGGLSPEDPIPQPHLGGYFPNEEPRVAMEED